MSAFIAGIGMTPTGKHPQASVAGGCHGVEEAVCIVTLLEAPGR